MKIYFQKRLPATPTRQITQKNKLKNWCLDGLINLEGPFILKYLDLEHAWFSYCNSLAYKFNSSNLIEWSTIIKGLVRF